MLNIFRTNSFKKDYKKLNSKDKEILKKVIIKLANNEELALKYNDHKLIGNFNNYREYHIKPDLL